MTAESYPAWSKTDDKIKKLLDEGNPPFNFQIPYRRGMVHGPGFKKLWRAVTLITNERKRRRRRRRRLSQ